MSKRSSLLSLVAVLAAATTLQAADDPIGKKIADFKLRDFRGLERSLSDFADSELVAVIFVGTDCPLAKLYAPRLEELHQQYESQGVAFLAVNSNRQDSMAKVGAFKATFKDFPQRQKPGSFVP